MGGDNFTISSYMIDSVVSTRDLDKCRSMLGITGSVARNIGPFRGHSRQSRA